MKNVSTAATKQSGNISQQRLTIGLDLVFWDCTPLTLDRFRTCGGFLFKTLV